MLINEFPDIDEFRNLAKQANVIPVCMEMLADTETPVSLLRKIYKNNPSAFLFESVEGGERWEDTVFWASPPEHTYGYFHKLWKSVKTVPVPRSPITETRLLS